MQRTDFARGLPDEVWATFEPILPVVVGKGNGRKPQSNYACRHAVFYVLVTGIAWEMLPVGFPSSKTIQRRRQRWLQLDVFRTAWKPGAERYQQRHGINGDQLLLDGSQKPSQKGGKPRGRAPSIVASAAQPCT